MNTPQTRVDYRQFRLNKLNTPEFSHLKLLLFWPFYGIVFLYLERFHAVEQYHVMYCPLDSMIPFQELFLIPYLFWFVFLGGMVIYTLFADVDAFKKMMKFVILTHCTALLIFFLFPTCQYLRPLDFPRDNVLTRFMAGFYRFDTSTNVCPSLHAIGSVAAMLAGWDSRRFSARGWKLAFLVCAVLITLSTVFLKQHSVLDLVVAAPICLVAWILTYRMEQPVFERRSVQSKHRKTASV